MTIPTPLAEAFLHQADETPEIAAIREALSAGPTPGPWHSFSYGGDTPSAVPAGGRVVELPLVYQDKAVALLPADASYIAACNPAAITAVLAHFDAALKARDAEIARLRDDARPGWRPIATAPKASREMFVVRAFDVTNPNCGARHYTSDAYCVWPSHGGGWVRWPHPFPPTHWMPLPDAPDAALQSREGKGVGE